MPSSRPDLDFDEEGVCDACPIAEAVVGVGVLRAQI